MPEPGDGKLSVHAPCLLPVEVHSMIDDWVHGQYSILARVRRIGEMQMRTEVRVSKAGRIEVPFLR